MNNFGYPPYEYDFIDYYNSTMSPSTVHVENVGLMRYLQRYYLQKAISVFDWTFPDEWKTINADSYFLYVLYCWGIIGIVETDKFGVIPQQCTLTGYNIVYQPSRIMISNPLLRDTLQPRINIECALIQMQPDYLGIMDMVNYYAEQKALMAQALAVNTVNSKLSFAFAASSKAQAESLKKLYDNYASGEPAVFYDTKLRNAHGDLNMEFINKDVKNSYIVTDILNDMKLLDEMFDTEIGIPNSNHNKQERLLKDEINANNFETKSKAQIWLETMQRGCEAARELFGIDLSVDWRDDLIVAAEAQQTASQDARIGDASDAGGADNGQR